MKRQAILILFLFIGFAGCEEKMKKTIEPGPKEIEQNETVHEVPENKEITLEEIAEMANKGILENSFEEIEIESQMINEGMDKVRVVWINRGKFDEVRIDFRPKDSLRVLRVTAKGRQNPIISKTGLQNGMTIDQVNSLNRKPVDFFGFNWDFGGAAKFNEGALEDKNILVYFKTDKKVGREFIGDSPHSFEEAKQANLELYVNKIIYAPAKNNKL